MDKVEDWWLILELLEQEFSTSLDFNNKISSLSGGEFTKLNLAICLAKKPELLLLDEPTNHLDANSLDLLEGVLKRFAGSLILVSHDPSFVDKVCDKTWYLDKGDAQIYGGNYSFFEKQKQLEIEAKQNKFISAKKELSKILENKNKDRERAQRSLIQGKLKAKKANLGKAEQNFFKNRSEAQSGKNKLMFDNLENEINLELEENKSEYKRISKFKFKTDNQNPRTLINIENAALSLENKGFFRNLNFYTKSGERILLQGNNGSGKSSFIKTLFKIGQIDFKLEAEKLYLAENLKFAYLDQNYDLVNKDRSLIENINIYNQSLSLSQIKYKLAEFDLLKYSSGAVKASDLSGGEVARLALAMLSAKELDLLILDEPTNNLDVQSMQAMVKDLESFRGGLILISHNQWFVDKIGSTKTIKLSSF